MAPLTDYYRVHKDGGLEFTQAYFDLSLRDKKRVALRMELEGLLESPRTLHRLGNALMQHSTPLAKEDWPCWGVRKLSKKAREADNDELPSIIRAIIMDYPDGNVSLEYLATLFEITEDDLNAEDGGE
jgi:hypothetical protein